VSESVTEPGYRPHLYPVSVKGVVLRGDRVLLLRNERQEWELPGGKLDPGETPEACVAREIAEESGWEIRTGPILDTWVYDEAKPNWHILIVTYGCHLLSEVEPVVSSEHKEAGLFSEDDIAELNMPNGYKRSIAAWYAQVRVESEQR
jgi:ADP-ribose pyrophosphatase YjhB (NUDIX family)